MENKDLFTLYMNKNIESVHNIYKDVEFLSKEKDALEELESNMQSQLRNLT